MKPSLALLLIAATAFAAKEPVVASHPQRTLILKNLEALVDARSNAQENHFFIRRVDDIDWIFWREGRRLLSTTLEPFAGDSEMSAEAAWELRIRHCREQIDLDHAAVGRIERPRNVVTSEFASRIVYECTQNGELVVVRKKPNKAPEPTTTAVTSPAAQEPRQP